MLKKPRALGIKFAMLADERGVTDPRTPLMNGPLSGIRLLVVSEAMTC